MTAAPDFPLTRLALRCWRLDRTSLLVQSLNAPASRKASWMSKAMASPDGTWPHDRPLAAACAMPKPRKKKGDDDGEPEHGPVPDPQCSCGIYATTDLEVIGGYLSRSAPVLGVVELGGRVIPATQGYRAAYARVAAILLIDEFLTEPHSQLRKLADAYRVPAVVPWSVDAEDYREVAGLPGSGLAAEAEAYLRRNGGGS